ncbi:glycosyltransferase family 9 protein [Flavobacterium jejuense]|uniref:Glycosyltransferase family 9 protein n=1 Tax=Flavobacterium jejuense TaxID=1544455 RepID=A0ABX0ILD4_9FLAO|nr:glycosyltransferase family 9 protein [Flavobacterium jejuense]NHN24408.1 glycosyltransferase family 9 protein [Flavobacterium jejuense]
MKILIIQQKRIGDVLTSTILSNNLKKAYPNAEIDYMCYANCVAVLENNPNIANIIVLEEKVRKNYFSLFRFIFSIRNKKYDIIIDAYSKLETNLITFFSGSKYKISYKKGYSRLFYNYNIERLNNGTQSDIGLAIINRLRLLKPLISEEITDYKPKIFLTVSEINDAKQLLASFPLQKDKPTFMIGILGSEWYKTYPFEKMAELLDYTVATTNANLLFNYIPKQKEDAQKIYNLCQPNTQKRIYFDLYANDLRSFLGLLSQCNALIGNEGGSVNMAKALFVPTFSLFSPSVDKETWQIFEDERNISIHLKDLKPEIYKEHDEKFIKEHTFKYFEEYPIDVIKEKLASFFDIIQS